MHFLSACSLHLLRHRPHRVERLFAFCPQVENCGQHPSAGLPYGFRRFRAGHTGDLAQSWPQKYLHCLTDARHIPVPAGDTVTMGREHYAL